MSEWTIKPNHPDCPCGGKTRYYGEALMGSLTCNRCGEYLAVVGWEMLRALDQLWIGGYRGYMQDDAPQNNTQSPGKPQRRES